MQHRHHARLVALAGDGERVAVAGRGNVARASGRAPRRCAGRSRRAAPARRRRARKSRARAPRRRAGRRRQSAWRRRTASGFGSVLPIFGARTAASAPTLPLPSRSRKRAKERRPASARISERPPMPSARRSAMKARTSAARVAAKPGSVTRCRRDARPGKQGTGARRAHRPRAFSATCAVRRARCVSQRAISAPRHRRDRVDGELRLGYRPLLSFGHGRGDFMPYIAPLPSPFVKAAVRALSATQSDPHGHAAV